MEEREVRVPVGSVTLEENLDVPEGARGVVLFAHGSGSGWHSPRNRFVAEERRQAGWRRCCSTYLHRGGPPHDR
jgi:putative phosphoribosyl transferase